MHDILISTVPLLYILEILGEIVIIGNLGGLIEIIRILRKMEKFSEFYGLKWKKTLNCGLKMEIYRNPWTQVK